MQSNEMIYAYWLNSLPGFGNKTITCLLKRFCSPRGIYETSEKDYQGLLTQKQVETIQLFKRSWRLEEEYDRLLQKNISFTTINDHSYPIRLKNIPDAPYGIFWKGKLPQNNVLSVAIVGARVCSEYGRYIAMELGKVLGQNGIQVISGMAKGIDGISQNAALEAGGTSFAVLGCGVDICYPAQNETLYQKLLSNGGVLSTYPPNTSPHPSLFPPRNRIVSGLSEAVVVIEARQKSGTLITVDTALEQGREVYVVPGRLTDRLSDGCNKLIKQGAAILLSPEDFLSEIIQLFPDQTCLTDKFQQISKSSKEQDNNTYVPHLSHSERQVLSCLDFLPRSIEQIQSLLPGRYSYAKTIQHLMRLCIVGEAEQIGSGYFHRKKP